MELRDYLAILRKHAVLVVVCAVLALAAAAGATALAERQYEATAQLFVSTSQGADPDNPSGLNQGGQFAQQRVKSYADLVDSSVILGAVVEELDLGVSAAELAGRVDAEAPLDTVLINISASYDDPGLARTIANRTAERLIDLVDEIEGSRDGATSPVRLSLVRPAEVPGGPSSPRPALNLALGLLVGLAVGVGTAVLREVLDTTVKSTAQLQDELGLPSLGVVALDSRARTRPLVVADDPHAPRAEAFRQLRTNLQYVNVDKPPRSLVVTSALSGEGKSTTACNLALTLAQAGVRVAIIDADLRRPRAAQYLGLEGAVGLSDVLAGRVQLVDVLQEWGGDDRLAVLPAGGSPPNPSELLGSEQMKGLLATLLRSYDVVVLDAPPLLPVTDAAVLAAVTDGAVLVVRAGKTTRDQVRHAVEGLRSVSADLLGVVLNMVPTRGPDAYTYGYGYGYRPEQRDIRSAAPSPVPVPAGAGSEPVPEVADDRRVDADAPPPARG